MSNVHSDCLNAVRDKIKTLNLDGIAAVNVQRKMLGLVEKAIKRGTLHLPAVVVSAVLGSERIQIGATVRDDDVGYPCTVAIIANQSDLDTDDDAANEANENRYLLWRKSIREAFEGQRLTGVSSVGLCLIEPANIVELNAWVGSSLFVSGMIVRPVSRDQVRG